MHVYNSFSKNVFYFPELLALLRDNYPLHLSNMVRTLNV